MTCLNVLTKLSNLAIIYVFRNWKPILRVSDIRIKLIHVRNMRCYFYWGIEVRLWGD